MGPKKIKHHFQRHTWQGREEPGKGEGCRRALPATLGGGKGRRGSGGGTPVMNMCSWLFSLFKFAGFSVSLFLHYLTVPCSLRFFHFWYSGSGVCVSFFSRLADKKACGDAGVTAPRAGASAEAHHVWIGGRSKPEGRTNGGGTPGECGCTGGAGTLGSCSAEGVSNVRKRQLVDGKRKRATEQRPVTRSPKQLQESIGGGGRGQAASLGQCKVGQVGNDRGGGGGGVGGGEG